MTRTYWLIEHIARGPYIGTKPHPKTGKPVIVCRAESSKPAMIFASQLAAAIEIDAIEPENLATKLFSIQPLRI